MNKLGGKVMKNKLIGITIFEEQLLRVFLLSDDFKFLRDLLSAGNVVVFTRPDLKAKIEHILKVNRFDSILVFEFKETKETWLMRLLSFMLKWLDPSTGTLRSLYRERDAARINSIGLVLRKFIYFEISNIPKIKLLARFLYMIATKKSHLAKSFTETPPTLNFLFITSLTNIESDLQVAIYYKKHTVPIIATVRSWDNLVTKGILRFAPDIFLSHSNFMSEMAIVNHGLRPTSVRTIVTPCYQKKFKPIRINNDRNQLVIAYGCIGPFLNPDEINFIKLLCSISQVNNVHLTIIQHPKFKHDLEDINLEGIQVKTFDYLNSTLLDYYSFLANQSFVIVSGTTLALDALFAGCPIIGLEFEIEIQNYWLSHLRSYDFLPHTKKLFDNYQIPRIKNEIELSEYLNKKKSIDINEYFDFDLELILGDENRNFNNELLDAINDSK